MFQLVIVVIAVGLAALLVVGGMPYFDSSTGTKIKVQQILQGQYEAIISGISAYKSTHGGFLPPDNIIALKGLMPQGEIPSLSLDKELAWSLADGNLCLSRANSTAVSDGVKSGINTFVQNVVRSSVDNSVYSGNSCSDTSATLVGQGTSFDDLTKNGQVSIIFKGF